ncbi:hypothetical protein [Halomarina ordinaria]|uniref:Small CPxCG-related zinc finger protein n=1 Tax=Halomarina ordinaria TaxID=3033939 RepID=A0ABD5UAG9_9EURY|nr:hypothetical protein [Halomarina sp. PSRA2]
MSDETSGTDEHDAESARMELGPDALHESDEGYSLDCPECGSPASLIDIVEHGRCRGYLENEGREDTDRAPDCTAELSLELVWES